VSGVFRRLFRGGSKSKPDPPSFATPAARQGNWYAPKEGDESRFLGQDGTCALHLIPYRDGKGEDVLRLCEDATGLLLSPNDPRLPRIGILVSQLRGEAYRPDSGTAGNFAPGSPVKLVPEPENPADDRAVAVYDKTGRYHCGYLNKARARSYLKRVREGENLTAISVRGTGAGTACPQIAILATDPELLARLLGPRPEGAATPAHLRQ